MRAGEGPPVRGLKCPREQSTRREVSGKVHFVKLVRLFHSEVILLLTAEMALNLYSNKKRATKTPKKYGIKCKTGEVYTKAIALIGKLQKS